MDLACLFPVPSQRSLCPSSTRVTLAWEGAFADFASACSGLDFVGQRDICLTHRDSQVQEPLLQHEVPPRPWAKVAADFCFHSGRTLLVVVDYFSNLIEDDSLSSETSKSIGDQKSNGHF